MVQWLGLCAFTAKGAPKLKKKKKSIRTFYILTVQNAKPPSRRAKLIYLPPEEYENALTILMPRMRIVCKNRS